MTIHLAVEKIKAEMAHVPEAVKFADFLATSRRGTARVSMSRHAFRAI